MKSIREEESERTGDDQWFRISSGEILVFEKKLLVVKFEQRVLDIVKKRSRKMTGIVKK